jgi:hypothetical protein
MRGRYLSQPAVPDRGLFFWDVGALLSVVGSYSNGLGPLWGLRNLEQDFLAILQGRQRAFISQHHPSPVEKQILSRVVGNEAIPFAQVEPSDLPVQLAAMLDPLGAGSTDIGGRHVQPLLAHLALFLHGKDKLFAAFLACYKCVSVVHVVSAFSGLRTAAGLLDARAGQE